MELTCLYVPREVILYLKMQPLHLVSDFLQEESRKVLQEQEKIHHYMNLSPPSSGGIRNGMETPTKPQDLNSSTESNSGKD